MHHDIHIDSTTRTHNMIANGVTDASGALEVAIVGAGIGGLTAAIALRRAGHRVTVSTDFWPGLL